MALLTTTLVARAIALGCKCLEIQPCRLLLLIQYLLLELPSCLGWATWAFKSRVEALRYLLCARFLCQRLNCFMLRRVCGLHSLIEIVFKYFRFVIQMTFFLLLEFARHALRNIRLADVSGIRLHKLHRLFLFVTVFFIATQSHRLAVILGSVV